MRNKLIAGGVIAVLLLTGGYIFRGDIRDAWSAWTAPKLPGATRYSPSPTGSVAGEDTGSIEGGVATSEHFAIVTSPPPQPKAKNPFEDRGPLPAEVNLDVPFTTQAPFGNWDYPYQEACEEASVIMVDAFYDEETGRIAEADAKKRIDDLVAYENRVLGYYKDTTAEETATFTKEYFKYQNVIVQPFDSIDEVKRVVANGYPVIIPASGKLIKNPNFKNGGPVYHMFVVKGYTSKGMIITNDPGTRNGYNYVYPADRIMTAAHDWNGGDVINGKRVMIVILPNS